MPVRVPALRDPARCFRAQHARDLTAVHQDALFDYYLRNGSQRGWGWGCEEDASGYEAITPAPAPATDDEPCRRTGCCIFIVEMGLGSTVQHVRKILRPDGFPIGSSTLRTQPGSVIAPGIELENRVQYTQEFFLHRALRTSPRRTWRVEAADYFFVASYEFLMRYGEVPRRR